MKKKLSDLVIDAREWLQRIVDTTKGILGIDSESGKPMILAPDKMLSDRERVVLYLVGAYLSHRLGKLEKNSATLKDLSQDLGISYKVVKARVSELRHSGVVEDVGRGEVRIRFVTIEREVKEINAKSGGAKHS